jgi:putative DNA primase/helicase
LVDFHLAEIAKAPKEWREPLLKLASHLRFFVKEDLAKLVAKALGVTPAAFMKALRDFEARKREAESTENNHGGGDALHKELVKKCGPPVTINQRSGAVTVNQSYFVQRFCREHLVLFEQAERAFYVYAAETGAWCKTADGKVKEMLRLDWERLAPALGGQRLLVKCDDAFLNALLGGVRSHAGCTGVFKRMERGLLHLGNGMLKVFADGRHELRPFDPQLHSRNAVPFNFNPEAKRTKFEAMVAKVQPGEDDQRLIQRWFGSLLLTGNAAHKIMLMVGVSRSSKSTLIEVANLLIGLRNCGELRTHLLNERFEIGRLVGKTFLTACDVPGNFFQHESAQVTKKLVGHDWLVGEIKGSMADLHVLGDFDAAISCNEGLTVRLRGETDVGAWRERLMLLEFKEAIPKKDRVSKFAETLIKEEGEGILAWAIEGAKKHLKELEAPGANFHLTAQQQDRVERLLNESLSVRRFVEQAVCVDVLGDLSTDELVRAYFGFCRRKEWRAMPGKTVEKELPDLMMEFHNSRLGTNIQRPNEDPTKEPKRVRGYPNVALVHEAQE